MVILAISGQEAREEVVGIGQYAIDEASHTADVAFLIRDDLQGQGIATELLTYLTQLAKKHGLLGFTADVLHENTPMLRVFEKMGFDMQRRSAGGMYELHMAFRDAGS